jgi:hypothetical protein
VFETKCEKCGAPATVQMNLSYYCSQHAFERVMAAHGVVSKLKAAK